MEERWRLEDSDNELKFFFDDKLIIHLFKYNGSWNISVLGQEKIYQNQTLTDAIQTAKKAALECGWI